MKIAIVLGEGPEVAAVLNAPPAKLPQGCIFFRASTTRATGIVRDFPALEVMDSEDARGTLQQYEASDVIVLGVLKMKGNAVRPGRFSGRLVRDVLAGKDGRDVIHVRLHNELSGYFSFPKVKSLFPFLFANADVAVRPDAGLLKKTLAKLRRGGPNRELLVDGETIMVYTVAPYEAIHSVNRCLSLDELKRSHRERGIRRFFFDRNRTIVIGLTDMKEYVNQNGLTLQSFV